MKLIDVHSHVQFHYFDEDRDKVMMETLANLETIINVGADMESNVKGVESTKKWPIYATVGLHPDEVDKYSEKDLESIRILADDPKVVAIGECGLEVSNENKDNPPNLAEQAKLLESQLKIAQEKNKPVIFHCRNAYEQLFEILKRVQDDSLRGLIHCWMGTEKDMQNFLSLGLGISFTGNITYPKNDYIRDCAKVIPLENLFVETDCPFLPPQLIRGQRNEPKFVQEVARAIAEVKNVPIEVIIEATSRNSKTLFNLN